MGYQLGVDLGTTYSAAAIGRNGRVEMTTLGTANPVMPSVVLLRADGEVLTGEVAVRRGLAEPTRVAREFKRRLGDPTPLVLGGTPYAPEALMGHLLRDIVRTISEREGEAPERVVLTHPATYGPYKLEQMKEVARLGGLDLARTSFLTEPQAAAISYASRNRVDRGEVVAVYDFGGGTFDVALVQRTDQGFAIVGRPEGMERFGGIDVDAAIVSFVDHSLDGALAALDPADPAAQAGMARLRDDCRAAKEALSGDTDTSITVGLPGLQREVRLTRSELEDMVRPRLSETLEALERAVRSAGLTMDRVSKILLVGGSSRMPLVGEYIQQRTGRPVAADAHPKFAIAQGAAGLGLTRAVDSSSAPQATPVVPAPPSPVPPIPVPTGNPTTTPSWQQAPAAPRPPAPGPGPVTAPQPFVPTAPSPATGDPAKKRNTLIGIGVAAALVVGLVVFLATRGSDSLATTTTTSTSDVVVPTAATPTAAIDVTTTASRTTAGETTAPATAETTAPSTVPPATDPPTTLPPAPATKDQLTAALPIPSEIQSSWIQGTFVDQPDAPLCGQTLPAKAVNDAGVTFSRSINGFTEVMEVVVGSYENTATALRTAQALRGILFSCGTTTSPDNSQQITFRPVDEKPIAGCQLHFAATLGFTDIATSTPLGQRFISVMLCGNNASVVSMDAEATGDPVTLGNELLQVQLTTSTKMSRLPEVP